MERNHGSRHSFSFLATRLAFAALASDARAQQRSFYQQVPGRESNPKAKKRRAQKLAQHCGNCDTTSRSHQSTRTARTEPSVIFNGAVRALAVAHPSHGRLSKPLESDPQHHRCLIAI